MKKKIYITLFVLLAVFVQFGIHALIENWYIGRLLYNFKKYSFGLDWRALFMLHHVLTWLVLSVSIVLGFWQGKYWWRKVYEKREN